MSISAVRLIFGNRLRKKPRLKVRKGRYGLKSLGENLDRSPEFGGSPLLQQRGATLQRCGNELDFDYAL
jgi:hypothetical protein